MGIFQPAVLSTAVWQDFLPFREFQVRSSGDDDLTTATARYPTGKTPKKDVLTSRPPRMSVSSQSLQSPYGSKIILNHSYCL